MEDGRVDASAPKRFTFIDGLRGIAALAVILPHSTGLFAFPEGNWACRAVVAMSPYGGRGVQIFFVISGFVIAYSLRNATNKSFSLGTFVLRRSVRLDPPYWVAIAAVLLLGALQSLFTHRPVYVPTLALVVAHLFYLQGILFNTHFNIAFWTLCIEFQLYLVFALLLMLSGALARSPERLDRVRTALVLLGFIVSLPLSNRVFPIDPLGNWFIPYWYLFLAGVLLCWSMLGRCSHTVFLCCLGMMVVDLAVRPDPLSLKLAGVLVTTVIYAAIRLDKMETWLAGPVAQLVGRLSYSIYLVHAPIALVVLGLRTRIDPTSSLVAFAMQALLYALTIGAAYLLHRSVEVPALKLAARLKRPRNRRPA